MVEEESSGGITTRVIEVDSCEVSVSADVKWAGTSSIGTSSEASVKGATMFSLSWHDRWDGRGVVSHSLGWPE